MLHFRQTLRRSHDLPQALLIKLIRKCPRCLAPKCRPHRDYIILLGHILMNRIVGEARERKSPAREKNLNLIRGREFLYAVKNVAGLFLG